MTRVLRIVVMLGLLSAALAGFCSAAVYEDNYIKIYATSVTYNRLRRMYEATGSVSVKGPDFRVSSPYVKYYPDTRTFVADDKFTMDLEGKAYRIFGRRLEYNLAEKTGNAMLVRINFGETFLGGSFMKIDREEGRFNILNGYFTGCNLPDSHYHVSSTEIVFYPRTGLMVAYWGIFWLGPVPTVPVPTFVYNAPVPELPEEEGEGSGKPAKKYINRKRDIWPKSGLGYNSEDGYFATLPFDYYFGPHHYMRTHLSWSEEYNLGIATGLNYILWTDRLEGEFRVGTNNGEGTYGGVTQIMAFGRRLLDRHEDEKYVYDDYFPGNKYWGELAIDYSDRERINYYKNSGPFNRVSFLPKVSLRANRNNFINDDFTYFSEVSWAKVSEEGSGASGGRRNFKGDVTFSKELWLLGVFGARADYDFHEYDSEEEFHRFWDTATQNLSLTKDWWGVLETGIGHTHIFFNKGGTPYEFEGYWFSPYDTLSTSAKLNFFFITLTYSATHDRPTEE